MLDPNIIAALLAVALLWLYRPFEFVAEGLGEIDWPKKGKEERPAWHDLVMFKGGSSAPAPDPAIGRAAEKQAQLGKEWLNFAKDQFEVANTRQADLDELTKKIGEQQVETGERATRWSQEDREASMADREWGLEQRDRLTEKSDEIFERAGEIRGQADKYRGWADQDRQFAGQLRSDYDKFRPVNERMVEDSLNWDSDERMAEEAAGARADVLKNSQLSRQQRERRMASMGIDPRSGRFQGMDRAESLGTALASTGAQNQARDRIRGQAVDMRSRAAGLGQNVLSQSQNATQVANSTANLANSTDSLANSTTGLGLGAQGQATGAAGFAAGQYSAPLGAAGLGVSAGNSALSGAASAEGNFRANQSTMGEGYSGAMQGYGNQASILNQQYQNKLNAWGMNQQAQSQGIAGIANALGTGIGAYAALSDKDKKTKKKPVKGALAAIDGLPVEAWEYKDGVKREVAANVIPPDDKRHVGTYAQDFARETGIGDGKTIPLQDAIGVTMKAVQELNEKVDKVSGKRRATA